MLVVAVSMGFGVSKYVSIHMESMQSLPHALFQAICRGGVSQTHSPCRCSLLCHGDFINALRAFTACGLTSRPIGVDTSHFARVVFGCILLLVDLYVFDQHHQGSSATKTGSEACRHEKAYICAGLLAGRGVYFWFRQSVRSSMHLL